MVQEQIVLAVTAAVGCLERIISLAAIDSRVQAERTLASLCLKLMGDNVSGQDGHHAATSTLRRSVASHSSLLGAATATSDRVRRLQVLATSSGCGRVGALSGDPD